MQAEPATAFSVTYRGWQSAQQNQYELTRRRKNYSWHGKMREGSSLINVTNAVDGYATHYITRMCWNVSLAPRGRTSHLSVPIAVKNHRLTIPFAVNAARNCNTGKWWNVTIERLEMLRIESMEELGFGPSAMRKIKKCPKCGRMASSENDFCRECGSRLPKTTMYDYYKSLHRVCPECETVVNEKTLYCPHCGTKLKTKKTKDVF